VTVYDEVEPDPSDTTVVRAGKVGREAEVAAVIAVGGGSSMDAGKAIAAEIGKEGWVLEQDRPGEPTEIAHEVLPIVCVPTTAGTASEVTPFSVITYTETERKLVLNHEKLYAHCAMLDPTLLTSAPREVRVAAGMDALTHAVESYVSRQATPDTRRRSAESIRGVAAHLRTVAADTEDLEAQQGMQRAAMIAGLAFSRTRLGIVHAMALPLSALFGVPHGIANSILLPRGMRFNYTADTEGFAEIAQLMGESVEGLAGEEAALRAVEAVEELAEDIAAPSSMAEVGVEPGAIERMAEDAMQSAHVKVNPREIAIEDVVSIYQQAM
jgi:alcohol dehydrogenase class IV